MTSKFIELESWISEILPFGESIDWVARMTSKNCPYIIKEHVEGSNLNGQIQGVIRYRIFTEQYEYLIRARDDIEDDGYLGCIMSCRKMRAGEDWARGRDLPDGKFNRETWDSIVKSIIGNELVKSEI